MTVGDGGAHESLTGIGDAGRARVRHNRDAFPSPQTGEHLADARRLGVIVHDQQRSTAFDARVRQQPARAARVFATDHVGGAQRLDGARRQVAQVSDRSGNEDERARHLNP